MRSAPEVRASAGRAPAAPAAAIGRAGEDLLRRSAALLAAAARRCAPAHDAEAVHDPRVAARRLEAALGVWSRRAAMPARAQRGAPARRLAGCGAPRAMRASSRCHVELLEAHAAPGPVTRGRRCCRSSRACGRSATARAARLASLARPGRLERVADRVATVALTLAGAPDRLAVAERRAGRARARAAGPLLEAAGAAGDGRLHAARIALKKWRYAEESLAAGRSRGPAAPLGALREAQQALGSIHDHAVLRVLVRRRAKRAARAGDRVRSEALASLLPRLERARLALRKGLPARLRALADAAKA